MVAYKNLLVVIWTENSDITLKNIVVGKPL